MENNREFPFTEENFAFIKKFAKKTSGIEIPDEKSDMVYTRFTSILRKKGMETFDEYCAYLSVSPTQEDITYFINTVTTNLTHFFREPHHFDFLKTQVLPYLKKKNNKTRCISIWSLGCSSGQEPYSLAFTVKDFFGIDNTWNIEIKGIDIDTNILKKASEAIYELDVVQKEIEESKIKRWFLRGKGDNDHLCKVRDEYKKFVKYYHGNVLELNQSGQADVIFCRNTLIYFDPKTQLKILDQFHHYLKKNGYLFVGHSEAFVAKSEKFRLVGRTIHQKI